MTVLATTDQALDERGLLPGEHLEARAGGIWQVHAPKVRWTYPRPLEPGWYEVRLGATSFTRFDLRKRLELTFDPSPTDPNTRPVAREAFAWNRAFSESFMVLLTRPVDRVRLDVWQAEGELKLTDFRITPVSKPGAFLRAIHEKLRLVLAYRCFGGALLRGGKLLLRGDLARFGAKLLKGLTDARVMQLGQVMAAEADASWWRRHALPAEEAELIRQRVDAMRHPPGLAILLPIVAEQFEAARLTAQSVKRQIYPHWQLHAALCGTFDLERELERHFPDEPRFHLRRVAPSEGIAAAIGPTLSNLDSDRVLVLPPGVELAEHALALLAEELQKFGSGRDVQLKLAREFNGLDAAVEPPPLRYLATRRLTDNIPSQIHLKSLDEWTRPTASDSPLTLEPVLAYPIQDRPLLSRVQAGQAPKLRGQTLFLGADLRGIGGYDHVAYAMLRGLPSLGVDLRLHPIAAIRGDLVPPSLLPPVSPRKQGDAQLVMGPPFLVARFNLDSSSAVYTMWETDRLDPKWIEHLQGAKLLIVPSQWQADCFRADGLTTPIEVVPLGYDPLVYHPTNAWPEVCTFGTAGTLTAGGLRKNAQGIVELFRRAFPTEADVRLRIKITPGSPGIETYDDPRIDVLRAVLPHPELAQWYRSLSAYVNGSLGEGFGLHLIEAMACGRPLISAPATGLTAFFDAEVGYAVDYDSVRMHNEIYTTGTWAQPREEAMIAAMREVYRNPAQARAKGDASATRARRFTWKAMGQQLGAVLRRHGFLNDPREVPRCG